jgi:L-asparaginase
VKRIVLLSTGGTIASTRDASGRSIAGALAGESLVEGLAIDPLIRLEVRSVFQKPSNAIGHDDWAALGRQCEELISGGGIDGIVITHGTDTLEDTAYYLHCVLDNNAVPVVVTGAQRVPHAVGPDAHANIRDAISLAASKESRGMGVLVLFNQSIFSAGFVRKVSSFQLHGFDSPGLGCLGYVDEGNVTLLQRPLCQPRLGHDAPLPPVHIVPVYAGADPAFLGAVIHARPAGLVLDGLGRGHVPPLWASMLRDAVGQGITVLVCSSTLHGATHQSYEFPGSLHDLETSGAIGVNHVSARKARIRLSILLANGVRDPAAIRQAFDWQPAHC